MSPRLFDVLERAVECALRRRLTSVARLQWRVGQMAKRGRQGPGSLRRVLGRRPRFTWRDVEHDAGHAAAADEVRGAMACRA